VIAFFTALAAVHLAAAVYVQRALMTTTPALAGTLVVTGLAVGALALGYAAQPGVAALAFLSGFGAVHVPAAAILLLKRSRGGS
jgi:hypothetical protein